MTDRRALLPGVSVWLVAMAAYWLTLYPGLMASGDTAKFQYLGRVLGTAHNPGYPLFVVVSHLFSLLPVGDLAFRMNLLSAVLAASAAGLMALLLGRWGVWWPAAVATGLAMAFGPFYWEFALRAEVYALAALLQVALLFFLMRWHESGRRRDLFLAAATVALGLGHHLTIVTLLPAAAAFVCLTGGRDVRRPATVVTLAAIVAAGLLQYLFIVVRTLQGAPALESSARNLAELIDVVRGGQFESLLFAETTWAALVARARTLAGALYGELGPIAIAALLAGTVRLARLQPAPLVLLAGGAAGAFAFACVYSAPDYGGFLLPVAISLWPIAGVGLDGLRALQGRGAPVRRAAVVAATCLLPILAVSQNYRASDHSRRTFETEYFRALFDSLPERSVLVSDSYSVGQMILYKLLGERAAGTRDVRYLRADDPAAVRRFLGDGYQVFSFSMARDALREHGFQFSPVHLVDRAGGTALPIAMEHLPLFSVTAFDECLDFGNTGWVDVGEPFRAGQGRVRVRVDNFEPFESTVSFLVVTADGAAPRVLGHTGNGTAAMRVLEEAADAVPPEAAAVTDAGGRIWRVEARVNDEGQFATLRVDAGPPPLAVYGRALVDLDNPRRATVCSEPLNVSPLFASPADRVAAVPIDGEGEAWLAAGWYAPERTPDGQPFRWTAADAPVLVLLAEPHALQLEIDADSLSGPAVPPRAVSVSVNGVQLEERPIGAGRQPYVWDVPAGRWRSGLNEIVVHTSPALRPRDLGLGADDRLLGLSVMQLTLRR